MRGGSVDGPVGRYGMEIAIMQHMRWSWTDLMSAPDDLVEEVAIRMGAEARWTAEHRKQQDSINQQLAAKGRR